MKRILMVLSLMPLMAFATTWYVDGTTGTDENSGTSPAEAKATIQAAIDASADSDTILVAPGTYAPINAASRRITIRSLQGAEQTIIDGGTTNRCVDFYVAGSDGEGIDLKNYIEKPDDYNLLVGFTIQNGYAYKGGGVRHGRVANCIFRWNNCGWMCGSALEVGCADNCLFYDNYGSATGWCLLMNCTLLNDNVHAGLTYNCIVRNGSIVWAHQGKADNNFFDDPHFVDAANGDYRLAVDSPCIDAGDNSYVNGESDLDGSGRIVNGKVDIGCYEYGSVGGPYVEKVGETNWTYMIRNGRAVVGDGENTAVDKAIAGAVNVPTTLRTRPVVAIDGNAFLQCEGLTSVTIPASVKTIGNSAFWGCSRLADVYFEGDTISSIGHEAFTDCYWDLIMHVPTMWQGRGRTICGYSVWKGDDPNETVRVVATNVVVHYMTTNVPVEVVAPISQDTGIVNVMTEVKGGNVAIPDSWAKGFPTFETQFGSNFTDALTRQTGKYDCNNTPMLVWQDYVAGTDPTNPSDTFTATITMVGGVPQVQWKPVLTDEAAAKRTYRKFGKVKLTDEWAEIPSGHEADYNFFKVTVEMK